MYRTSIAALGVLFLATGCAFIKPTTLITVNPFTRTIGLTNTKDVDLSFDEISAVWAKDGGSFKITNLVVSDKSSPVIGENVKQMDAFTRQQEAANRGIEVAFDGLSKLTGLVTKMAERILPGSGISVDSEWASGEAHLGPPATQPP